MHLRRLWYTTSPEDFVRDYTSVVFVSPLLIIFAASKTDGCVLHPMDEVFATCNNRIALSVRRMTELRDAASAAQQSDMKEIAEATGTGKQKSPSWN